MGITKENMTMHIVVAVKKKLVAATDSFNDARQPPLNMALLIISLDIREEFADL